MSPSKLAPLVLLTACAAHGYFPMMTAPQAQPEPEPVVDTRSAGQIVVDTLAQQGFTCNAEDTRWQCLAQGASVYIYVSYFPQDDGSTVIKLDSFVDRAFAKPCHKLRYAMQDLADASNAFAATCDDSTRQIQMQTQFAYGNDVAAWMLSHQQHTDKAFAQLNSIHAIASN